MSGPKAAFGVVVSAGLLLAAGCAQLSDRVILLPEPGNPKAAVVVQAAQAQVLLNEPYAIATVKDGAPLLGKTTAQAVQQEFGQLLQVVPQRPRSYMVYFVSGSNQLTPESLVTWEALQAELKLRAVPDVVVVGHTDRVGTVESNDRLSLQRAERVRDMLVSGGLSATAISVAGRGEREPLVSTADEVDEPRNRRVEIKLR